MMYALSLSGESNTYKCHDYVRSCHSLSLELYAYFNIQELQLNVISFFSSLFMQKNSLGTIRSVANVCCVQFSPHSTHLLAFGSADYRTYCYDLRYAKTAWCVLAGHEKAVSFVKFLDSETLVSASTDNTLKLWDLNKSTSAGLSPSACSLTLSGHTNEKVGWFVCFFFFLIIINSF